MFATNTRGPFLFAREALPYLRASHGRIVNLGSLGGLHAWADHAHYCSSKAALHMLTQTMAKAFAPEISVNCVAPGSIDADGNEPASEQRFAEKNALEAQRRCGGYCGGSSIFCCGAEFRHRADSLLSMAGWVWSSCAPFIAALSR